jgi:hypothetical protein
VKTAREIINELERAYEAVTDINVRHPEDGSDVDNRFETYDEYDEALSEELEALSHAVKAIIEENQGGDEDEPTGQLSGRTLEVVLAALRYMQEDLEVVDVVKARDSLSDVYRHNLADILESGPTTPEEIDRIAEALNTQDAEEI